MNPVWDRAEWVRQAEQLVFNMAKYVAAVRAGMVPDGDTSLRNGIAGQLEHAYKVGAEDALALNTMANPTPGFIDETLWVRCPKCLNRFLLGPGMDVDPKMKAISMKHLELCQGDAAITLSALGAALLEGWRP